MKKLLLTILLTLILGSLITGGILLFIGLIVSHFIYFVFGVLILFIIILLFSLFKWVYDISSSIVHDLTNKPTKQEVIKTTFYDDIPNARFYPTSSIIHIGFKSEEDKHKTNENY